MMFAKGKYVNADGLSSQAYYLRVPPDKLREFQTAVLKASHHDYLALATDQGCRLRAVLLEGRLIRQLPIWSRKPRGRTTPIKVCLSKGGSLTLYR